MSLSFSFPQHEHLRKRSHFDYVYQHSTKIENRMVRFFFAPALGSTPAVAFIASKRTGNAVKRNLCRRRLKEIYRLNRHQFSGRFDMVMSAKHAMVMASYAEIEAAVLSLLRKVDQAHG